jgi:hypothetical protein
MRSRVTLALAVALAYAPHADASDLAVNHRQALVDAMTKFRATPPGVVLVTMGVGSLIWERHGHIALCIRNPDPRADRCYNYGIADFFHPLGMAAGFFRGTHSFWVGEMYPEDMLWTYIAGDRSVWLQLLPLDGDQQQQVIEKLKYDIQDDHRYYAYDHFDDNCTTRIRDVIDNVTDHALRNMPETTDDRTFRDLAREGFFGMRVPLIITDIAMGRSTDRRPSYYERMFLPQYLREAVEKKFGIVPNLIYERRGDPPLSDGPSGRLLFALIALVLCTPAVLARWRGKRQRLALGFAVVPYALLGAILLFLALISPLPYVEWNESVLVFFPLDVLLIILRDRRRRLYARGRLAMLGAFALGLLVGVFKQPLWAPLVWPLVTNGIVALWPQAAESVAEHDARGEQVAAVEAGRGRRGRARPAARRRRRGR